MSEMFDHVKELVEDLIFREGGMRLTLEAMISVLEGDHEFGQHEYLVTLRDDLQTALERYESRYDEEENGEEE